MVNISVVMSVYNAQPYLSAAINSILRQTYKDFEFIIINDGSTDRSADIIKSFKDKRIIFLQQKNKGLAYSLNRGISEAQGKYIARMDADDESMLDRLAIQEAFLVDHPEYIAVGSNAIIIDKEGQELYKVKMPTEHNEIINKLPFNPVFFHSSVIFSKPVFLKCGGYNEKVFHFFEDQILWNQMARLGKFYNITRPLIKYRKTPSSITYNYRTNSDSYQRIISRLISDEELSLDDLKYIQKLKYRRPKSKRLSDYYYWLGNVYCNILSQPIKAVSYYISALKQNPFNLKALARLILSIFKNPKLSAEINVIPWSTIN